MTGSGSPLRIASIDRIRGVAMILMAIDHVRVFSGVPAGGPQPAVFFTRWITHFCAPAFVFLAGTSAFLYGRRHDDLSRFLFVRGAWLVVLELTVLRLAWTFNLDFRHYELAGVIWVIGWSMIALAGLVKLPPGAVAALGLLIVAGHNLMDPHMGKLIGSLGDDPVSGLWRIAYVGFFAGPVRFGPHGPNLVVLYSLIPWVGVMALGYAFGPVLALPAPRRDRICGALGLGAIALFLVLRGFNLYGDPHPWQGPVAAQDGSTPMPALLSFLNTSKYPASLLFLLMTLGPVLLAIPFMERVQGLVAGWLAMFGRVPLFFYLLHIPLIHLLALIVSKIRLGVVSPWLFANHPMDNPPPPAGYVWSLPLLYAVWVAAIAILYFTCRWFTGVKARSPDGWLRYL